MWAPDRHCKGAFATNKTNVIARVEELGATIGKDIISKFSLIDGFFSESLTTELQGYIKDLIFVNIDVDIHSSTVEVLNWITPLLRPGVVIYLDDFRDPLDENNLAGAKEWGENLAWRQWMESNPNKQWNLIALNALNQRSYQLIG